MPVMCGKPLRPTSENERAICVSYRFSREATIGMPRHTTSVRLDDRVDQDALQVVLRTLVQRHDVFRTSYVDHGGIFMAQVHDLPVDSVWEPLKHQGHQKAGTESLLGPEDLYTISVIDVPVGRLLRVETHHIISDAWSVELLKRDLVHLLERALATSRLEQEESHDAHARPYREYAEYEQADGRRRAREERLQQQLQEFASQPSVVQFPQSEVASDGNSVAFALTQAESDCLRAVARCHKTTPFTVLTSLFLSVLSRRTGEQRLMVGTSVINRPLGWGKTLGFFANRTFASLRFPEPLCLAGAIDAGKHGLARMWSQAGTPCPRLVEELGRRSVMHRTPRWRSNLVFEFYFNRDFGDRYLRLSNGAAESGPGLGNDGKEDLELVMAPTSDTRFAGILCCSGRVRGDYIATVLQELKLLLSLGALDPLAPFDRMPGLTPCLDADGHVALEAKLGPQYAPPTQLSDFWKVRARPPYHAPSNPHERLLNQLIVAVTGITGVGRHDDLHLHAALTRSEIAAICGRGRAMGLLLHEPDFLSYSLASDRPFTIASLASQMAKPG